MPIRSSALALSAALFASAACACAHDTPPAPAAPPTGDVASTTPAGSTAAAAPASTPGTATGADWIKRSNEHAKLLLEVIAKFSPETAAQIGFDGYDDRISDFTEGHDARLRDALTVAMNELKARRETEADPHVKQDLSILVDAADLQIRTSKVHQDHEVPFTDVAGLVFGSLRGLLEDRIPAARRPAAVVRLRGYTGLENGTKPVTELVRAEMAAAMKSGSLMPPSKVEVEKALQNGDVMVDGIEKLLAQYKLPGYEEPLRAYKKQIAEFHAWLRSEVLPRARSDFRLAPEVYAVNLENFGVDAKPEQIAALGHEGFKAIQAEIQKVAAVVAHDRHMPASTDYRDVIRALKKDQLVGEAILPAYRERLAEIEAIIRREKLVTLPDRPARIRLASEAESAATAAPFMSPPRLLGNTGEQAEFVLPLRVPAAAGAKGGKTMALDDFTYKAMSWALTAHEARPGHELQFASLVERGVSTARAIFAFNSANVEGWGLYAESLTLPYMPPEGQLATLQQRLARSAREFLDPELQMGKVTTEQARAVLEKDVVYSPSYANSEIERYTFRAPGQATSYFYGFTRLMEVRKEIEAKQGAKFNLQRFNDWVISQGLLPPTLLREAALKELVGGG